MIGRRCKHSNVFSRPVLIARNLSGKPDFKPGDLSQEIYCGGYISVDPPLPIPNREVKHTGADGSAIPSVRVGSCRFSRPSSRQDPRVSFFLLGLSRPKAPAPSRSSMTLQGFFHFNIISDIPYRPFNRQTTVSTPRKVPDPGGPLMRTSIIGARPPGTQCWRFPKNHLTRQSPFYGTAGHIRSRGGIDLCPSGTANPSRQHSRAHPLAR